MRLNLIRSGFAHVLIVYTALTYGAPANAVGDMEVRCKEQYSSWIQSYGGSDPFLALDKTTPWKTDKGLLTRTIKSEGNDVGQVSFNYLGKVNPRASSVNPTELLNWEMGLSEDQDRDEQIKYNVNTFFQRDLNSDTVRIAYVGLHHAIDVYLSNPSYPITYLNKPFNLKTEFNTTGFNYFFFKIGFTVSDKKSFYSTAAYSSALALAKRYKLKELPSQTLRNRPTDPRKILIGEFHPVRSDALSSNFVSATCLKSLGINKVFFAVEGYSVSENLTTEVAKNRRNFYEGFSYYASKSHMTLNEYMNLVKKNSPRSEEQMNLFFDGKVVDNLEMYSFFEKLQELSQQGIQVQISGLEAPNYKFLKD